MAACSMAFADNGNGVVVTARSSDDCQVTPVIHVLQYPGCVPKPIPSFACTGRCSSYLQVKSKIQNKILFSHDVHNVMMLFWFAGLRVENLADGKVLHVLSRERRTGGIGVVVLPESQTRREEI